MDDATLRKFREFILNRNDIELLYEKTPNTNEMFPIYFPALIFEEELAEWTHDHYIRLITWEITGLYTKHAQENLVILREYLNQFVLGTEARIIRTTLSRGKAYLYYSNGRRLEYDFQKVNNPTSEDFLSRIQTPV